MSAVVGLVCALIAQFSSLTATSTTYATLAGIGWLLCGVFALVLLGIYSIQDNKIRAGSFYVSNPAHSAVRGITLGLAMLGVVLAAVEIALFVSKL
ncbi:hypothetical protein [Corynebacterium doosanense]|uniref:hypothetical protein n=1 Tax=Corynebacterium doosanense TaxID=1121358 RepID=UPI00037FA916|nr:hypothetical protein [Corynebacterium doosanense]